MLYRSKPNGKQRTEQNHNYLTHTKIQQHTVRNFTLHHPVFINLLKKRPDKRSSYSVSKEFLEKPSDNEVVAEIKTKCDEFLKGRRDRRIIVYCHYINNATGIYRNNEKEINNVLARFNAERQLLGFSIQVYGVKEILELAREGKIQVGSESLE